MLNHIANSEDPEQSLQQFQAELTRFRLEYDCGMEEVATKIGNHTFRATGITAYLKNGGTLENAAAMANHASTRTTQLYDRRPDDVTLDEVERVLI